MADERREIEIPAALWKAATSCAIHCQPDCCGQNAFELTPEEMRRWALGATADRIAVVLRQADDLIAELARSGPNTRLKWFSSDYPEEPRHWLEDVRECVIETTNPPADRPAGAPMIRRVTANLRVLTSAETWNGHLMPAKPFERAGAEVLLPDRPLWADVKLPVEKLEPGEQATVELRFPLPARIQPWLMIGGTLDLDHHRGTKTIEVTILALG